MPNLNTCITINGVSNQLSKLNPHNTAGPDNHTSRILKELHSEVAPMLTDIFNSSLHVGKVPMNGEMPVSVQLKKRGKDEDR